MPDSIDPVGALIESTVPTPRPRPKEAPQTKFPPYKPPQTASDYGTATYPDFRGGLETYHLASQLAPEGIPWQDWRQSKNVEPQANWMGHLGSVIQSALAGARGYPEVDTTPKPSVTASQMAGNLGIGDVGHAAETDMYNAALPRVKSALQRANQQMMLPTVPQMNPVAPFNKPQFPGMPQTGLGTNINQQLLTLLGGLGGMPANPLAPGISRSPQPGPPTNTATQILGALGSTNP